MRRGRHAPEPVPYQGVYVRVLFCCGSAPCARRAEEFFWHAHKTTQHNKERAHARELTPQKVIGPTLGAVLGAATDVVALPVGLVAMVFSRARGRSVMHAPCDVYTAVAAPIPI